MRIYNQYIKCYQDIPDGSTVPKYWNTVPVIEYTYRLYAGEEYPKNQIQDNDVVKWNLKIIDIESMRSVREYLVTLPDCPNYLKQHEDDAKGERKKLKP